MGGLRRIARERREVSGKEAAHLMGYKGERARERERERRREERGKY